jgi:hypothetical protein
MTSELIIGIGQDTLDILNKLATQTMLSENHTPLDRFASLILNGMNEDMKSNLPDGVGTVVHITNKVVSGYI